MGFILINKIYLYIYLYLRYPNDKKIEIIFVSPKWLYGKTLLALLFIPLDNCEAFNVFVSKQIDQNLSRI